MAGKSLYESLADAGRRELRFNFLANILSVNGLLRKVLLHRRLVFQVKTNYFINVAQFEHRKLKYNFFTRSAIFKCANDGVQCDPGFADAHHPFGVCL